MNIPLQKQNSEYNGCTEKDVSSLIGYHARLKISVINNFTFRKWQNT